MGARETSAFLSELPWSLPGLTRMIASSQPLIGHKNGRWRNRVGDVQRAVAGYRVLPRVILTRAGAPVLAHHLDRIHGYIYSG